jgi:hypothetical protein
MSSNKPKPPKKPVETSGDVINITSSGDHNAVAAGRGATASVTHIEAGSAAQVFETWRKEMDKKIDVVPNLQLPDKTDLKDATAKISVEAAKGPKADIDRLERLINTLNIMAPDIFEVAIATLVNPMAGIGLVLKKVGDRAKLEAVAKA